MHNDINDITALILAGGQSTRMGENKAALTFRGKSLLRTLTDEMESMFPVAISRNPGQSYEEYAYPQYVDRHEEIGAMGGIHSGLLGCGTTDIFVVSCDTPSVTKEFAAYLCGYRSSDFDVLVPVLRSGKVCPTIAIYNRRALPVIERHIEIGMYKLLEPFKELRVKYVPLGDTVFPDEMLDSINTKEEYAAFLRKKNRPVLVAISGVKKSGKTTLLTKILPLLNERGYKVATIKYDAHEFCGDVEGTDTYRHFEAGALGTTIFSSTKFMLIKKQRVVNVTQLRKYFADADIILLEGFKNSEFPKIEIVRKAVSDKPIGIPETILAIASDCMTEYGDVPVFSLDDAPAMCDVIEGYVKKWE